MSRRGQTLSVAEVHGEPGLSDETANRSRFRTASNGCLEVGEMPPNKRIEAFELNEAPAEETQRGSQRFFFAHSARKSIMMSLGFSPDISSSQSTTTDILRPYSKASENICVNAYFACMIGTGAFKLSRAISTCGWLIGVASLVGLSTWHMFVCLRLLEVPQLIEQNVSSTVDLSKIFFSRRVADVFLVLSIITWFFGSVQNVREVKKYFELVFITRCKDSGDSNNQGNSGLWFSILLALALGTVLMHSSLKTGLKDLERKAKAAVYLMLACGFIETFCAIVHAMRVYSEPGPGFKRYKMVGTPAEIAEGFYDMMFAFAGISLLPYILAELVNPNNARAVVIDAGTKIMAFYLWLGIVAYLGWAKLMEPDAKNYRNPPLKVMQCYAGQDANNHTMYSVAATVIGALFFFKTVCTFPLIFWPLYREVDVLLMLDESPAVKLKLPWAIRRQQQLKLIVKVFLIAMILVVALGVRRESFAYIAGACTFFAMNVTQFMFPAWSLALAIRRHMKLLESRKLNKLGGDGGNTEGVSGAVTYLFGNLRVHYIIVHAIALLTICLSAACALWRISIYVRKLLPKTW